MGDLNVMPGQITRDYTGAVGEPVKANDAYTVAVPVSVPQRSLLLIVEYPLSTNNYKAIWIVKVGEVPPCIGEALHKVVPVVRSLFLGMRDVGRQLTSSGHQRLVRALDLDNGVCVVGPTQDEIGETRAKQVWLRPDVGDHRVQKLRVLGQDPLECWLIVTLLGDEQLIPLKDGLAYNKPAR